ncbi:MAG: hypothetical protein HYX65_01305 [Gemmatimonadetes bacterium]|nr:hypothetical protein [Gemmatimonadota bacterium]
MTRAMAAAGVVLLVCTGVRSREAGAQGGPAMAAPPPPAAEQVAGAVLSLPEAMRAGARVLGYGTDGKLVQLRPGTNDMTCLADEPGDDRFHAACYANSMEPFMARGRELRLQGVKGDQVDTVRFKEVKEGKLKLPTQAAALYQLFAKSSQWDAATGKLTGAQRLYVVYVPYATTQTTGLSTQPQKDGPWLMLPGTPKAHIMFQPSMNP